MSIEKYINENKDEIIEIATGILIGLGYAGLIIVITAAITNIRIYIPCELFKTSCIHGISTKGATPDCMVFKPKNSKDKPRNSPT